jgi:hypothetical protein
MLIHPLTRLFGRMVGWFNQSFFFSHPVQAIVCDADVYDEDAPAANTNGTLIAGKRHAGLIVDVADAGEQRPLAIIAASQWLYTGVRLLGRYLGDATVGEGEEADTREVYAVTTCRECLWAADYFERADGPTGEDWTDIAGTSAVASGKLATSSANAIFRHRRDVPDPGFGQFANPSGRVTATVFSETVGAQAKLIGGYGGTDDYAYLLWEFADGVGKAWIYDRVDGTNHLKSGPWLFLGRGAGVATRLRFCWFLEFTFNHLAAELFIDDSHQATGGWFAIRSYNPGVDPALGGQAFPGHGLGTGALPSGTITFDDYRAEIVYDQRHQCPLCHFRECWYLRQLCLRVSGTWTAFGDPAQLDQTKVLSGCVRSAGALPCGGPNWFWGECRFWAFGVPPIQICEGWDVRFEQDETTGDWTLIVTYSVGLTSGGGPLVQVWERSLGTSPPRCDLWGPFVFEIGESTGDTVWAGTVAIRPRTGPDDDCFLYYYAGDDGLGCCGHAVLPETVHVTIRKDGEIFDEYDIFKFFAGPTGFNFYDDPENRHKTFGCTMPGGVGSPFFVDGDIDTGCFGGFAEQGVMTILSCDPFHVIGTCAADSGVYDVEITE